MSERRSVGVTTNGGLAQRWEEGRPYGEAKSDLLETARDGYPRYSTAFRRSLRIFSEPPLSEVRYALRPAEELRDMPLHKLLEVRDALTVQTMDSEAKRQAQLLRLQNDYISKREAKGDIPLEAALHLLEARAFFGLAGILDIPKPEWKERKDEYIVAINRALKNLHFTIPAMPGREGFEKARVFSGVELGGKGEYGIFLRVRDVESEQVYGLKLSRPKNPYSEGEAVYSIPVVEGEPETEMSSTTLPVDLEAATALNEVAILHYTTEAEQHIPEPKRAFVNLLYGKIIEDRDSSEQMMLALIDLEEAGALSRRETKQRFHDDPFFAVHVIQDLVSKVEHAINTLGVVHKDLKPGNILLARRGEGDSAYNYGVKLCDLGTAYLPEGKFRAIDRVQELRGIGNQTTTLHKVFEEIGNLQVGWNLETAAGTYPYGHFTEPRDGQKSFPLEDVNTAAHDVYCLGGVIQELISGNRPTPAVVKRAAMGIRNSYFGDLWNVSLKMRNPDPLQRPRIEQVLQEVQAIYSRIQDDEQFLPIIEGEDAPIEIEPEMLELIEEAPVGPPTITLAPPPVDRYPSFFDEDPDITPELPAPYENPVSTASVQIPGRGTLRQIVDTESGLVIEVDDPEAEWDDDEE